MPSLPAGVSLDDEIAAYDLRVAALAEPTVTHQPIQPAVVAQSAAVDEPAPALPPIYVPGPVPDLPAPSAVAQPASQTTGSCASCGLTLSATARFCRRCGTPQHLG